MAKPDQRRRVCSCSVSSETRLRRCRSDPNRYQPQTDRLLSSAGIAEQSPTSSVVLCSDLPGDCISRISAARPMRPSTPKQTVYRLVIAAAIDANGAAIVSLASTGLPSRL